MAEALKINDLIIQKMWNIRGFDLQTGKILFSLKRLNSAEWANGAEVQKVRGGEGNPVIGVFAGERFSRITAESAVFDLNLAILQLGDSAVYGTNVEVPWSEEFTIPSATAYTVTLSKTPVGGFSSAILTDGTTLIEGETVTSTTYTVAGKVITFDASCAGKVGTIFYSATASSAVQVNVNSKTDIKYCKLLVECQVQDVCTKENYMGYIIVPKASIDPNFQIAIASTSTAVQGVEFEANLDCGYGDLSTLIVFRDSDLV